MRPFKTATIIASTFLFVSVAYIFSSDWVALELTRTADQLRLVQSVKGATYVGVVAAGLFGLTFALLSRVESKASALQAGREALLDAERRTLVGTLAASIAHDVNNLLGAVEANVRYAQDDESISDDSRAALADAAIAADRLVALNKRLIKAARNKTTATMQPVDLNELLSESIDMIRTHSRVGHCRLETAFEAQTNTVLKGNPDLITNAVINLVLNAGDATSARGHVRVSVTSDGDLVDVVVEDDGPGVAESDRQKIKTAFFTTKEDGSGLGLFSVVYCAEKHRGEFLVGESELGGAKMTLRLPTELGSKVERRAIGLFLQLE